MSSQRKAEPGDGREQPSGPIGRASTEELATELTALVAGGLPVVEDNCPVLLSNLRSVVARSVVPREPLSRLNALNALLPRLVAGMHDATYREALQILLALAPGTRGTTLTARRRQAAECMGYNADYFRTDIEVKLIRALAGALQEDLLRYQGRGERAAEAFEPTGQSPSLEPEDVSHEEELISRIWQHVYGLRAELITMARYEERAQEDNAEGFERQGEEARQAALAQEKQLQALIGEYKETYGEALVQHGQTEFAVEGLERLAGWEG